MSNEVAFNSLEKDDVKITFNEGSSDLGKPTEEEVAQHKRTRLVLVVLFGIIVLAMVVAAVIIIIVSPACEQKKGLKSNEREKGNETTDEKGNGTTDEKGNETTDDLWWKRSVMYQIYPRSFFDSNDDGNGDLSGISKKLEYFSGLGVNAFLLNPIYDPKDFMAIEKTLGSMEDFETFVNESHNKGFKVILDFVPNHTSKQHPWFVESSKDKTGPKNDWYVWADAGVGGNGTNPPNNWVSEDGGSAWEYENSSRQQFYLHQFKKDQPDLNLRNREVIMELKKVLEFWLSKGVDGFRIKDVQYFLEDANLTDETKPSPNTFSRNFTYDLEENRKILKEFQEVINNGSKRLLIADVEGARSTQYYDLADIIQNVGLITKLNRSGMTLSQGVKNTVVEYIDAVPAGKVPNWLIGNIGIARVGSRLGHDVRNAMNVLQMTLPGIVTTYYGEEIGMLNGVSEKTPMQWSDESYAGFSSQRTWMNVAPSYLTLNVKIEKANTNSFYNNYIKLAALRKELPFATGEVKIVQSDPKVFAFLRSQGVLRYLVVINFGDKWDGDIAGLSGRGLKVFDSEEDTAGTEPVDVNKLTLNPGQAVIVNGTSEHWFLS